MGTEEGKSSKQADVTSVGNSDVKGASTTPIVWIDCEMTGLEPSVDEIVEVAVIVTDANLTPLAPGIDLVVKPSDESLSQMGEFVINMHTESGLINVIEDGVSVEEAEQTVLEYLQELVPDEGKAPLAGSSVSQDMRFLRKYMPKVANHLNYRIVDVSSIKELAKRWYPRVYVCAPEKTGGHRALGDIEDSIDELRYYRAALFPEELNPTSGYYRDLAAQILAEGEAPEGD